jgi:hypothetical protein
MNAFVGGLAVFWRSGWSQRGRPQISLNVAHLRPDACFFLRARHNVRVSGSGAMWRVLGGVRRMLCGQAD